MYVDEDVGQSINPLMTTASLALGNLTVRLNYCP